MSAEWEMKKHLIEIIENADLPQEKAKNYTWFKLKFDNRQLATKLGDYNLKTHVIRIFNDKGSANVNVILTLIHEASHHIDWVIRGKSNHDKHFYYVHKMLLYSAFDLNKITKEDILQMNRRGRGDKKIVKMALEYHPNTSLIQEEQQSDKLYVNVYNCYNVKDILKENGFRWNAPLKAWYLAVEPFQLDAVKEFLDELDCDDYEVQEEKVMKIKR